MLGWKACMKGQALLPLYFDRALIPMPATAGPEPHFDDEVHPLQSAVLSGRKPLGCGSVISSCIFVEGGLAHWRVALVSRCSQAPLQLPSSHASTNPSKSLSRTVRLLHSPLNLSPARLRMQALQQLSINMMHSARQTFDPEANPQLRATPKLSPGPAAPAPQPLSDNLEIMFIPNSDLDALKVDSFHGDLT